MITEFPTVAGLVAQYRRVAEEYRNHAEEGRRNSAECAERAKVDDATAIRFDALADQLATLEHNQD